MPTNAPFRCLIGALLLLAMGGLPCAPAAAETLRVGKAVAEAFSFVPLDIGMRKGFFAKQGLDIEAIAFTGDARMQQAMASDSPAAMNHFWTFRSIHANYWIVPDCPWH
jgi:ABC-type nitrate/sulfonate/bicarbonate transport system substrate-binding protein